MRTMAGDNGRKRRKTVKANVSEPHETVSSPSELRDVPADQHQMVDAAGGQQIADHTHLADLAQRVFGTTGE